MSAAVVMLVTGSDQVANNMTRALERVIARRPARFADGDQAVLWVGANACQVAIVDHHLPGVSGIETVLSMRQRCPDLPIVMISDAGSERAAIDAFHARVTDYVPKHAGYEMAVAQLVKLVLEADVPGDVIPPQLLPPDVPDQLLQLTYQNRLRAIGRQLDLFSYRGASILEVAGGFLVRAVPPGTRQAEALEFPNSHFPQLLATSINARGEGERRSRSTSDLLPSGYEDFLRAVGYRLDVAAAEAVAITELGQFVAVGGVGKVEDYRSTAVGPFQWLLRGDDITYLLNEAYRRRKRDEPRTTQTGSRLDRLRRR